MDIHYMRMDIRNLVFGFPYMHISDNWKLWIYNFVITDFPMIIELRIIAANNWY